MQEALALVRQELGSQAAVLHTREVRPRGIARLWGSGELIEVVASDNVSVPGRLAEPSSSGFAGAVPHTPSGIDLSDVPSSSQRVSQGPIVERSPLATYLERGVRPMAASDRSIPSIERMDWCKARTTGGASLLVVCGGTHGVGTTTVSWNLAQALAQQGRRTVWVNADLSPAASSGPHSAGEGTLADVLAGRHTIHEVLTRGPFGVQCIRRALGNSQSSFTSGDAANCVHGLKRLSPHVEIVVVDAGSEANVLQSRFWQAATAICLVVTPADEAILRGYAAIKHYREHLCGTELTALVNHASEAQAAHVVRRMAAACRQFLDLNLGLAGQVASAGEQRSAFPLDQTAERFWELLGSPPGKPVCDVAST